MICYLSDNSRYLKSVFVIFNVIIVYALYLTDITLFIKIFIIIIACILNYIEFSKNHLIKAFYLTNSVNKSILLTKQNKQIKVNFIEISYFNAVFIILCFSNKLKSFEVLVFRWQVGNEFYKALIILARYNFLPHLDGQ